MMKGFQIEWGIETVACGIANYKRACGAKNDLRLFDLRIFFHNVNNKKTLNFQYYLAYVQDL